MNRGRSVIVVGASGTIGSSVARELDSMGFRLGLHYCSNSSVINNILAESGNSGQHCVGQSSLENLETVNELLDYFFEKMGNINGLALCAGRVPWKEEETLTEQDWEDAFRELCVLPFHIARRFIDRCDSNSKVVGLSSISAHYGGSTRSRHYGAAKSAFETALLGLCEEAAEKEIAINLVRAGFVISPQQTSGRTREELLERATRIPFRRAGRPEEVARVFALLFNSGNTFMTGQRITVAGGD